MSQKISKQETIKTAKQLQWFRLLLIRLKSSPGQKFRSWCCWYHGFLVDQACAWGDVSWKHLSSTSPPHTNMVAQLLFSPAPSPHSSEREGKKNPRWFRLKHRSLGALSHGKRMWCGPRWSHPPQAAKVKVDLVTMRASKCSSLRCDIYSKTMWL